MRKISSGFAVLVCAGLSTTSLAEGLSFKSDDGQIEGRFGAHLIHQGRFFADSNPRSNTFYFRKARFEATGTVHGVFDYTFRGDFSGTSGVLDDGWFSWRLPDERHAFTFGQMKVPFSFEFLESVLWTDFPERSVVTRLAPAYDQGVLFSGRCWDERVTYEAGVFNGSGQNTSDNNDHKDYTGRLTVKPLQDAGVEALETLHIGAAITTGNQSGGAADITSPASGTTILDFDTGTSLIRARNRYGAMATWTRGPAGVTAEFIRDSFTVTRTFSSGGITTHRDGVTIDGWYIGATCLLTGEEKRLGKPVAVRNAVVDGGWGAWEVALRAASWNPSQNLFRNQPTDAYAAKDTSAEKMMEYSLGLNFYPANHVRFSVAWIVNDFDTPIDIGNRQTMGDENVILTRAQIDF